ncbi:hypothetical protein JOQ06_028046 [Pogonophryne albipinna]|uniref:Uncharacterized protein n=1 Tax=Pogonophryne albipinna TaxID=1090488 RepID=A0AAD6AFK8_9TELE|nr:hypothetical protein JOQ06_028046 [Pogonophryne albipinna]
MSARSPAPPPDQPITRQHGAPPPPPDRPITCQHGAPPPPPDQPITRQHGAPPPPPDRPITCQHGAPPPPPDRPITRQHGAASILVLLFPSARGPEVVVVRSGSEEVDVLVVCSGSEEVDVLVVRSGVFSTMSFHWSSEISLAHGGTTRAGRATAAMVRFTSSTWSEETRGTTINIL